VIKQEVRQSQKILAIPVVADVRLRHFDPAHGGFDGSRAGSDSKKAQDLFGTVQPTVSFLS
jgi:hypothetical protein